MTEDTKQCTKCLEVKSLEDFYRSKPRRGKVQHKTRCKACCKAYQQRYLSRPEIAQRRREWSREWHRANRSRAREIAAGSRKRLRDEFLKEYGSECSCCGERERQFLTLEHLNRDGRLHHEKVGPSSTAVLRDLRKRGWPKDGYTILCMNCNHAKGRPGGDGRCPHEETKNNEHAA